MLVFSRSPYTSKETEIINKGLRILERKMNSEGHQWKPTQLEYQTILLGQYFYVQISGIRLHIVEPIPGMIMQETNFFIRLIETHLQAIKP